MIRHIRTHRGISRSELARGLNLSPTTAGLYVDRLVRAGLLQEAPSIQRKRGRQPTLLQPNPKGGAFLGVDLEPQFVTAMIVDFAEATVARIRQPLAEGLNATGALRHMIRAAHTILDGYTRPLLGIGVGVPGQIDVGKGTASDFALIPGWRDVPLRETFAGEFHVPIHVENNIRAMAMAELRLGQGLGCRNFVCLGARAGIGTGVVVNGQLISGANGGAGHVGRWRLPASISPLVKGVEPSLESVSSFRVILAKVSELTGVPTDLSGLCDLIQSGHRGALRVLGQASLAHAWAINQLTLIFDPSRIIIVGPMAELGSAYLQLIARSLERVQSTHKAPEITCSTFGRYGGAYGAAALALHEWRPVHE